MSEKYSVEVCRELEGRFRAANLHRPMRIGHYDAGTELTYDVTGFKDAEPVKVSLIVEKFVGGGFAGQVYRVKIAAIEGEIEGVEVGGTYAIKILIPPTTFSRLFRNLLYWIGFQGPFQQQVNPAAARAGSLWQKFIRRAAKIRFGDEAAVVDIYGTFTDAGLGSCGELREWVEGRTWLLEVDDRLDLLKKWRRGRTTEQQPVGSPEYRAKYKFMKEFVALLHDLGAYEFARQYEWSTCKSQPNALKRYGNDDDPAGGLVAVDFRAGLALLPFLPMSPGDFKLIIKGLGRGSLVQFDRGSITKLESFTAAHADMFADMDRMLRELKTAEAVYRDSVPDITHNHIKLLYSRKLWSTTFDSAVNGWRVRNLVDEHHEWKFRNSKVLTFLFFIVGLIPLLGKPIRLMWGRTDWRKHYGAMLGSWDYFKRSVQARIGEKVTVWHRSGRLGDQRALRVATSTPRFMGHLPLSILPAGLHRMLTDFDYARERISYYTVRPVRLYFDAKMREQWLRDMISEGQKKHMLSDEDAETIRSQIGEPFIQKYLKSLAVHVCTLPVTQIVSVAIALIYYLTHRDQPNAWAIGLGIIGLFQVVPISPGSLVRGLYVLYLVIKERNFKDYNIAVFLGFFKYVGYLAFPIQMTYHYPALARFMAGHWATEAVHIVPVFGERGALLEHWVYCLFYNRPLTIRRRMRRRAEARELIKPRYWHTGLCIFGTAAIFGLADYVYLVNFDNLPILRDIWWLVILAPLACGAALTLGCGGAALGKRIAAAAVCGALAGMLYAALSATTGYSGTISDAANNGRAIGRNETVSPERAAPTTTTVNDNKAPEISSLIPDPNSFHVSRDTAIQLHITDGGSGVEYDGGAVTIRVEGDVVYDGANETSPGGYDSVSTYPEQSVKGICTRTGSEADYTFVFSPASPFGYGQKVDVAVNATDRAGNIMPEEHYYFHTVNSSIVASCVWRMFIFAILSAIGAIITEIKLPENWMIERKSVEK